jgi:transposase
MRKKYKVQLSREDRERCTDLVRSGRAPARTVMHARVLLKADSGPEGPGWTDAAIAEAAEVSTVTVAKVRQRFVSEGLEATLNHYRGPNREYPHKLDGRQEAQLLALAHSKPPEGRKEWSLRLLAGKMVELEYVDSLSAMTVSRTLKRGH